MPDDIFKENSGQLQGNLTPVVNGIRGVSDPMRQGLESALLGEGDPFNIAQEQPSDPVHYTPIWDVSPVQWAEAARGQYRKRALTRLLDLTEGLNNTIVK